MFLRPQQLQSLVGGCTTAATCPAAVHWFRFCVTFTKRSNSTEAPSVLCTWLIVSCRHQGSSYLRGIGPQFSIPMNLVIQALAVHAPHYQPILRLFRGRSAKQLRFHWLQAPRACSSRSSVASRVRPSLLLGMLSFRATSRCCHVLFRFLAWPHSAPTWLHTQLKTKPPRTQLLCQPCHCHHARPGNWSASRSCGVFLPHERAVVWPCCPRRASSPRSSFLFMFAAR